MSGFGNGGQRPDVLVKLSICTAAPVATRSRKSRAARIVAEPACQRLPLHAAVLEKGSPYFAALFSRWDHNTKAKSATALPELVVRDCEDLHSSELALELIYCGVLDRKPAGRLVVESVTQGLLLLKACSFFLSDFGVEYCGASLAALPWSFKERRMILVAYQELGLKLGTELHAKMTGPTKKILEGLFAAAVFRDSMPDLRSELSFGTWSSTLAANRAMPRQYLQKQVEQGWMGLQPEVVESIVASHIQRLPFCKCTELIKGLRIVSLDFTLVDYMLKPLEPLVCELSSIQWLSTFCLQNRLGLKGIENVWGTTSAEAFVAQSMKTLLSLYAHKQTKPLLELYARSVFPPLQLLLKWTCEDQQGFSVAFRERLIKIWMPILLSFEQARLLPANVFEPSAVKSAFESLCKENQEALVRQWSKELTVSEGCSGAGIEGFISSQMESFLPPVEAVSIQAILSTVDGLMKAANFNSTQQLSKSLAANVARFLKNNPERLEEVAGIWLSISLEGLRLKPGQYDTLLEASANILRVAASNQGAANRELLQSMLPVLTDADTNGRLETATVKNFEKLLWRLSVLDQEHVVLTWTSSLAPVTSSAARKKLVINDVFAKWMEACSEQKIGGA